MTLYTWHGFISSDIGRIIKIRNRFQARFFASRARAAHTDIMSILKALAPKIPSITTFTIG